LDFKAFKNSIFQKRKTPAVSGKPVRPVSRRELLMHLSIMVALLVALLLGFFFIYLPSTTNHDDIVTVPTVTGMKLDALEDVLDEHDLRYEVQDSDYVSKLPPLTVTDQFPKSGEQVKKDRRIFVTVVANYAPMVEMPNLLDFSLRSAQETLESFGLRLGKVIYKPDSLRQNAVLAQQRSGRKIEPETRIPVNTVIDIVVGSVGVNKPFAVPNLIGRTLGDAEATLLGLGLVKGTISPDVFVADAIVSRQFPVAGRGKTISKGERVDMWLSPPRVRPAAPAPVPTDSTRIPPDSTR
jgi:eukaryotic-like serine/threonine-protein kinase